MTELDIRIDDLSLEQTRALVGDHIARMLADSPDESFHALDVGALRQQDVVLWSAWSGPELAGIGALKTLDQERGEIKSMRVADEFLGRGVGRAILNHIVTEARARGMRSLWLETGAPDSFLPAQRLYETAGFVRCGPFEDYVEDPFSVYMTREL